MGSAGATAEAPSERRGGRRTGGPSGGAVKHAGPPSAGDRRCGAPAAVEEREGRPDDPLSRTRRREPAAKVHGHPVQATVRPRADGARRVPHPRESSRHEFEPTLGVGALPARGATGSRHETRRSRAGLPASRRCTALETPPLPARAGLAASAATNRSSSVVVGSGQRAYPCLGTNPWRPCSGIDRSRVSRAGRSDPIAGRRDASREHLRRTRGDEPRGSARAGGPPACSGRAAG